MITLLTSKTLAGDHESLIKNIFLPYQGRFTVMQLKQFIIIKTNMVIRTYNGGQLIIYYFNNTYTLKQLTGNNKEMKFLVTITDKPTLYHQ